MHILNIDVWSLMTKQVGLYAGPSLKFCLPVFKNFSLFCVSFSALYVCVCLQANHFDVIGLGVKVDQGLPCVCHNISRSSGKPL